LTYANASLKTVRGLVSSSWKKTEDSVTLKITIPVNSEAKVSVPKLGLKNVVVTESRNTVWKNGKFVKGVSGITAGTEMDDYVTFEWPKVICSEVATRNLETYEDETIYSKNIGRRDDVWDGMFVGAFLCRGNGQGDWRQGAEL